MKTMIYSLALATFVSLASCNNDDPVLTQKDWQGTATYLLQQMNSSLLTIDRLWDM